jgi:hypothetical protein
MVGVLLLGLFARAESFPYDATVSVPEVEVRSGPNADKFYATSKLRQGQAVRVVGEKNGWLAISPPPGSFSWVNARHLGQPGSLTRWVLADDTPVLIGSELTNDPPTVQQVLLQRGTQVVVLSAQKAYADNGAWLPIQPPPNEVRYLPREAVRAVAPVAPETTTAQRPPGALAGGPKAETAIPVSPPGSANGNAPRAGLAPEDETLWLQAQGAERAGQVARAEELYDQLARRTLDHGLQMRCYNHIRFLRGGTPGTAPAASLPGHPAAVTSATHPNPSSPERLIPTPSNTSGPMPPLTVPSPRHLAAAQYNSTPEARSPAATVGTRSPQPAVPPPQWSRPGSLRRTAFAVDGQPTFVLQDERGLPLLYVTAQPGLSLEPYVNRNLRLYGPVVYRSDLRIHYLTASQVQLLP